MAAVKLLTQIIAVALATAVASWLIPGIHVSGKDTTSLVLTLLAVGAIIAVVNAVVKPIVSALTGCLVILTLGLFLLVINAGMLLLSSWVAAQFGMGFQVDGFWPALFGGIVISVVSGLVSGVLTPARAR